MPDRSDILSDARLEEWVDAFFAALDRGPFVRVRAARMARVRDLNALSETELRAIGLSRELIPAFVFADLFVDGNSFPGR